VRALLERCLSVDRDARPSSDTLGDLLAALGPEDLQPSPLAAEQRAKQLARNERRMPAVVNRFARSSQILLVSGEGNSGAVASSGTSSGADGTEDDGASLTDAVLMRRFFRALSRADAEKMIADKPSGTFLLRSWSPTRDPLTLVFVGPSGEVLSSVISEHKDGSFAFEVNPNIRFPKLIDLLRSRGMLKFNDDLLHMEFAMLDARRGGSDNDTGADDE
jgi:hypothetical protein